MAEAALPLDEPLERDIVVVGASAGGVEALAALAAGLDPDFRGTMFVVLHLPEGGRSVLAGILDRAGPLDAVVARDGEPFEPGTIVVAPPGHHLLVERDHVRVVRGPKINGHRPAVDVDAYHAARERGAGFAALVPFTSARVVLMVAFDLAPELVPYPVVPSRSAALRALSEPTATPLDAGRLHGLRARAWDLARRHAELRREHDVLVMELRSRLRERHVAPG